ncbi:hypothetical protein PUN28_012387 [Cardiocondyla obscurior]|uniref:Uncharacterized protein n=1 Tax=Cardiocondyla obscurior TaxID=286306 RepID=A0AAW2FE12_9HYME
MNSRRRASHVSPKMHTRETNAWTYLLGRSRQKSSVAKKISSLFGKRVTERSEMRKTKTRKKRREKKRPFVSPRVGSQSVMHATALSIASHRRSSFHRWIYGERCIT